MNNSEIQKAKIRSKYKGINQDELDIIPAIPQVNFSEDKQEKRVAVYARVSTDDPRQTSSYELQKNHYIDVVKEILVGNLLKFMQMRGFQGLHLETELLLRKMIEDCKAGKIDLIVTKSVSRFARNVVDVLVMYEN